MIPDPSTEALAAWNRAMNRSYPTCDEALEAVSMTGRALAARLSQAEEAIRACIGDAEGQEAVREHKMLELTKGQVQLLAAALAASSAGGENA